MSKEVKQVIVWRSDLKEMPLGKKMAQAGHAAHLFLTEKVCQSLRADQSYAPVVAATVNIDPAEAAWMLGEYKKAVLICRSEEELQTLYSKARELGLRAHIVTDLGHTVFDGKPTVTCMAIGPNYAEDIDKVTGAEGPLGRLRLA